LSKSVFFFGIYIIITGLFMLLFPDVILGIIGLDISGSVVVRLLGMMLVFYGYYYIRAGIAGSKMTSFYWWTVHTRFSAIIILSSLALFHLAPPVVIAFGVIEMLGATWTLIELRLSRKMPENN